MNWIKTIFFLFTLSPSAALADFWKPSTWFKDPVATHDYSVEDYLKNPSRQDLALTEKELFFIDKGYIFRKDLASGTIQYVEESSSAKSILIYKSELVALREGGEIYLLNKVTDSDEPWISIGNSTTKILSTGNYLLALTDEDEIWKYKGQPGEVIEGESMSMEIPVGEDFSVDVDIPMPDTRAVAFEDTGLHKIKRMMQLETGELFIEFTTGRKRTYSEQDLLQIEKAK